MRAHQIRHVHFGAFVIVVYDLFFVQQAHAVKIENKDRL